MRRWNTIIAVLALFLFKGPGMSQDTQGTSNTSSTVAVHMVATVEPLQDDDRTVPVLNPQNIKVGQNKNGLKVTEWIPSRGEQAGLQLFILIDETSDTTLGVQLDDIRAFIQAQPQSTAIGLGYMRNTTVNILQNFTTDHAQVAKTLRLPTGTLSASDSVYLSLINVLKGWPENKMRREVLMISSGIDRLRGALAPGAPPSPRGVPIYISPDIDRASREAQKAGVVVHSIYTRGVGHAGRNFWEINNGQNGLAKLSDETGGESFFLGTQSAVSFKPYLDRLRTILDNQYFLVFQATPGKKADLQRVRVSTEIPKVEIVTADNVWVPTAPRAGGDD